MGLKDETSVVIAGAGPVGLGLACELGRLAIDCLLVEKRDGAVTVPKQSMVSARNMEFCRRWGVAEAVRGAVWPESHPRDFVYLEHLRGRELMRVKVPSYIERDRRDFTPEAPCPCPQIYFDPILLERVKTFPSVTVRTHTMLESLRQDDRGVAVRLADTRTGAGREIRARYLVGCDGPAGTVREALGIGLDGLGIVAISVNIFFRSAALAGLHDKGWARFYRLIDDSGCWSELIPIDGRELWRLTVFDEPLSAADPRLLLAKMAGGVFPHEILSVSRWERRDFVTERFGRDRVLIAGDAAHECSPTGGIGMHTGLEEAVNLAWKLAAMIEGWGGEGLIVSYEDERLPIARRNVELATRTFHAIARIPGLGAMDNEPRWGASLNWLSIPEHLKIQYAYDGSPICVADGTPPPETEPGRFVPTTRPGALAPHAWLADGRSTLDLFGNGFTLLRLGDTPPEAVPLVVAAKTRRVPPREVTIAEPEIAALYERKLVLVRPDGHVAWRGDALPKNPAAVVEQIRGAAARGRAQEQAAALAISEP